MAEPESASAHTGQEPGSAPADGHTLRLLLETTEQGVWFIDTEMRSTDANPAMCRMLGTPREALIGRTIWEFVDEDNAAVFREHLARRARGETGRYEITLTRPDGTCIVCVNNATPIVDAQGRRLGSVGLWTDITELKQAQRQLAEQTQALALTLEVLDEGVFTTGPHGRVVVWNRRLQQLLDLPEPLLQTRPTIEAVRDFQIARGDFSHDPRFASPASRALLVCPYQRTTRDGRVLEVDERSTADGSLVRVYRDVTRDVRGAEALRASEERFRTMADGAPALIWLGDTAGRPLWFNQRWLQATGRTLEQELALDWTHRMVAEDLDKCSQRYSEAIARQEPFEVEFRVRRPDGGVAWVVDHGIPRHDAAGRLEGFTCYGWDVSTRRAAEQALAAARDEAERLSRAKSEFLSRMSHELRTPLNAVLGFAQLLQNDTAEPLSPRQAARVQELQRGGTHLLHLIDDVLDLARIEAGRLALELQPVALAPLLQSCVELLAAGQAGARAALQLQTGPACRVRADPLRLRQVLLNLMSNALKYGKAEAGTPAATSSQVVVGWRQQPDGTVRIGVRDQGPGLDGSQLSRLFVAFERLGAERRGVEGAGIGLALSKWLVELMQGRIGVDSQPGQGSEFWVVLAGAGPDEAEPELASGTAHGGLPGHGIPGGPAPAAAQAAGQPALPGRRVLYIEDNDVNRLLMQGMLGHRPAIELLLAALPEEGLALARTARPALVLLDIQLPGIDGFEVLRRLRADPGTAGIPVVAVSANAMPADRERAAAAGFAEYVTKPIDLASLLAMVDRWLA